MKNLTKIFMAVVALFAVSCTTDMTGDLAPELGLGEGQTTLTLSLEESRTQLGEKANGVYPLYWSTGDQIAVNGTPSAALSEEYDGKAAARFSFGENTVSRPFHVIYPAPAESVEAKTEGCYPVVFPATQTYAEGTFAAGTAPMYGYAAAPAEGEEAAPVQMQHLTGILRLAVKGDATLSTLIIKAESGSLSGTYDVNCESGALTAQEGSTSDTVTVSFDGGLALKADEATPIYVAVPAGSYGAVRAILTTTEGKKMTIKFDSDSKPIAKATVREFTEFTFAENALDGDVFEIYDVEDMLMFAKTATSFPWSEAKLMATVDMAGVEWTPVDGFSKIFNGNYSEATPYEIKNLSAPLFGTVSATIKNVKLTDVNIAVTAVVASQGAIVRVLSGGTVENCEVSGSIAVSDPSTTSLSYGGIVGTINGASTLKDLTNRCNVTVTVNNNMHVNVGGILGSTSKNLTISNCDNYGAVSVSGTDTAETRVGGVIGYVTSGGSATADDTNNYANVTVTHASGGASNVGGIFGHVNKASSLKNSSNGAGGKVFVKGVPGGSNTGGLVGYAQAVVNIDTCYNCDSVKLNINCTSQAMLGGMVGYYGSTGAKSIKNSVNNGVVYAEGSMVSETADHHCRVGGFVGYSNSNTTIEDSTNNGNVYVGLPTRAGFAGGFCGYATGNTGTRLTNTADITFAGAVNLEDLNIGGCYGWAASCTLTDLTNAPAETVTADDSSEDTPSAKIVIADGVTVKRDVLAGGVVGKFAGGTLNNAVNRGAIDFKGTSTRYYEAGGVLGTASGTVTTAKNFGVLNFGGSASSCYIVGGVVGYLNKDSSTGLTNESTGTMTVNGTATTYCAVGGVVGKANFAVSGATNNAAVTSGGTSTTYYAAGGVVGYAVASVGSSTNNGTVTFGGTAGSYYAAGGVVGESTGALTSLTNESTATLTFNATAVINHNVGGVVGRTTGVDLTTLENKAALTYSGQNTTGNNVDADFNTTCVGGVVGAAAGAEDAYNTVKDLTNSGLVTLSNFRANSGVLQGCIFNFGGVIGHSVYCNLEDCDNTATEFKQEDTALVTVYSASSNGHGIRLGGIAGSVRDCETVKDCDNSAKLNLNASNGSIPQIHHYIGGLVGYSNATSISNCTNGGALQGSSTFNTKRFHMGGIVGDCYCTEVKSCTNNGAISYAPATLITNWCRVGGIVGYTTTAKVDACINNGQISLGSRCSNNSGCYIGGVVGYMAAAAASCVNSENYGNIIAKDTFCTNAGACVGGIVGTAAAGATIEDSKVFCSIMVGEFSSGTEYANVGFVLGAPRTATRYVTNCSLGGYSLVYDTETEETEIVPVFTIKDYFDFIYGGDTDWTGITNYDGCGFLESKTAEPSYPAAE